MLDEIISKKPKLRTTRIVHQGYFTVRVPILPHEFTICRYNTEYFKIQTFDVILCFLHINNRSWPHQLIQKLLIIQWMSAQVYPNQFLFDFEFLQQLVRFNHWQFGFLWNGRIFTSENIQLTTKLIRLNLLTITHRFFNAISTLSIGFQVLRTMVSLIKIKHPRLCHILQVFLVNRS